MLRVYCAGGAAGNIGQKIQNQNLDIDICYIDTSDSNLKNVNNDEKFIIPGVDGAGKDRSISYEAFKQYDDDILIRFKPSDQLNVVLSSLSGGSGSVIGPMIAKKLVIGNHNTIVIGIDSVTSLKELDNSVKTLKTYKSFADTVKKTISLFYIQNYNRKQADDEAIHFINLLSLMVNKDYTSEFDTTDLKNFINYDRVTDNPPSVSIIEVVLNEKSIPQKNTTVVGTILVTTDHGVTIPAPVPEYFSTCIITDPNYKNSDIRVDNILGKLNLIVSTMEQNIRTYQDNKKLNKYAELNVTANTDDGLVL